MLARSLHILSTLNFSHLLVVCYSTEWRNEEMKILCKMEK
jgi:hypothetical protein